MKREEIEARAWNIVCKDLCSYSTCEFREGCECGNAIYSAIQDAYTAGLEKAAEIAEGHPHGCITVNLHRKIAAAIRAEKGKAE